MTKEKYIESLDEIVNDEIFITNDTELLNKESSNNCWIISTSQDIIDQLTVDDLEAVIQRVKDNRKSQLANSNLEISLIFYLWYDDQASQLRFNLINSNHKKLPFGIQVKFVSSERLIIDEFLKSEYHDGIPRGELNEIQEENDVNLIDEIKLNVYKELLIK